MGNTTNTKKIALAGLFTALALIASFIELPIFPAAPWLKYDPSGVVCLIAALAFGPKLGLVVAVLSWLPKLFLDPLGMLMGVLNTCALALPAAAIYARAGRTRAASVAGMLVGGALAVALSCAANLVVTPLYTAASVEQVMGMIFPILLPFNLLKAALSIAAGQLLLAPCMNVLREGGANRA